MAYRDAFDSQRRARHITACVQAVRTLYPKWSQLNGRIVVTGTSGILVGPGVAEELGWAWWYVRKPQESTHTCEEVETGFPASYSTSTPHLALPPYPVIMIDDGITSEATLQYVHKQVSVCKQRALDEVLLYDNPDYWQGPYTEYTSRLDLRPRWVCDVNAGK